MVAEIHVSDSGSMHNICEDVLKNYIPICINQKEQKMLTHN